ncbi:unnamed protein product [Caenorhabditis bovis]|uniref:Uncharacterized protein n=1 Tax=Caenorhabditis bovis TaxID=2654633 RepID=A0A8S1F1C2_9PELO|nr:unnamed protein product [Caenorhabditis bovis]
MNATTSAKYASREKKENKKPQVAQPLTPLQAQIERNKEWIDKMSPVIKYKIQEYIKKQKSKKLQRRKFSIACGLPTRSTPRSRSKRAQSTNGKPQKQLVDRAIRPHPVPQPTPVENRRKSAPAGSVDFDGLLNDLE